MPNRLEEQVHVKKFASDKISSFATEDGLQIHVVIFCLVLEIDLPLTEEVFRLQCYKNVKLLLYDMESEHPSAIMYLF